MTMNELVEQVAFLLGIPVNNNIEEQQIEQAANIAFRELKRYMRTPCDLTVPYARRIDLSTYNIKTKTILNVFASQPRIGLTMSSIDSGNVFQVAASVNVYSSIGNTSSLNIDPIMTESAMAQVRNTLSTDFQWKYDIDNNVVYCTHRDPLPATITITYVPDYQDVSEIQSNSWIDYLVRLTEAYMKRSLGRSRSKYTVQGSNVTLDGDTLLQESENELNQIRQELEGRRSKLVVLN